ncbi:hypothetical protein FEM48_Zijuj08G0164500 [Ziziphus jujuba var. spinosa]|uniref:PHD finger protein ALFIN-LIKE n=1 Tax=Ziziphus jujuba var. spinosa TaxID=714518 RepID=A0A978V056_ZIZJJ|nr:hypothetical protein FEM48_Zijuj08G0164500 [Ziziphus jujuba var. spinosa]
MASSSATLSPSIPLQAMTAPVDDRVPDMVKRQLMNLILLGTISLPAAGMVVPYASFFVPSKEKENLCLYGLPNETWEVNLPVDEVPPELPDPSLRYKSRKGWDAKEGLVVTSCQHNC